MTDDEIETVVRKAVKDTLLALGFDVCHPLDLQADMQHLRTWRQAVNTVRRQSLITAIGVITAGILGLIYMAISGRWGP
jgi:hypothetical protein